MNLIFITLDGARLDRIKASKFLKPLLDQGTSFSSVITYAPYTIGAMHAIFSGEYGFRTGVNSYWSTYRFKSQQYKTLAEYFQDAGYKTYGDAINELILPKQGFDDLKYHDEDKDDLVKRHIELLNKMEKFQKENKKFFLYLHYSNIHTKIKHSVLFPFNNFSKKYFDSKIINEKNYDSYFKEAENYLKNILEHIKKIQMDKNTMIIIISDHGISVGEKFGERAYGAFCYDYTIKTFALFIKNSICPVKKIDLQVRSIDIMPTILDFFSMHYDKNYERISGKSLKNIIDGDSEARSAITETGNPLDNNKPPKEPNIVSLRKDGWKLILNLYNKSKELYNLKNDVYEENNLINKEKEIENALFNELIDLHPSLRKKWTKN